MDRHHLAYLNVIEKLNCEYCGYANGVFAYVREIWRPQRAVLVPDPARPPHPGATHALSQFRRLR